MISVDDTLAVLADIHGNIWALEAVLADLRRRGITRIVDLGDSLNGPLEPHATAERLMGEQIESLCGNDDRVLFPTSGQTLPRLERVRRALTAEQMAWLQAQPATRVIDGQILLCHGTPASDEVYLLEEPLPQSSILKETQAIMQALGQVEQPIICCGHSHTPRAVYLPGGQLIVNPGSVGLPAYTMDEPFPHKMESGSPHAKYAILSKVQGQWTV
ncbi:MAG TPA: metallophosphoesterase family protein, partial [Ktedonobacterales bacterium]|nr:metallophosphoesterase family protein [Ktedonobacterales bacterium]